MLIDTACEILLERLLLCFRYKTLKRLDATTPYVQLSPFHPKGVHRVALSYCWEGGSEVLGSRNEDFGYGLKDVAWSTLPMAFRQAAEVTLTGSGMSMFGSTPCV